MKYQIFEPEGVYKEYVEYFWTISHRHHESGSFTFSTFADSCPGIVLQQTPAGTGLIRNGKSLPLLYSYGAAISPSHYVGRKGLIAAGAVLKPAAGFELFGLNMKDLTNSYRSFQEADSSSPLNDFFCRADQALVALKAYLHIRLQQRRPVASFVQECLRLIDCSKGTISVNALLSALKVSERHLERTFARCIGVSPRLYLLLNKFKLALEILRHDMDTRLVDIAYDTGFSDQAHFNHVVKRFSGFTPRELKHQFRYAMPNGVLTGGERDAILSVSEPLASQSHITDVYEALMNYGAA